MSILAEQDRLRLIAAAKAVRKNAHAPYSHYFVGSALLTKKGDVFVGCNVENASYGATICAERNAIAQMVGAGAREPVACAVVTSGPKAAAPCGMCRQVLAEFGLDMTLLLVAETPSGDEIRETSLRALLPEAFTGDWLRSSEA
jgi:cytidine deaminase